MGIEGLYLLGVTVISSYGADIVENNTDPAYVRVLSRLEKIHEHKVSDIHDLMDIYVIDFGVEKNDVDVGNYAEEDVKIHILNHVDMSTNTSIGDFAMIEVNGNV